MKQRLDSAAKSRDLNSDRRRTLAAIGAPLIAALIPGCADGRGHTVGFVAEFSGPTAELAIAARQGLSIGLEELRRSGGIDGQAVELTVIDAAGRQPGAIKSQISSLGLRWVIGPMTSRLAVALADDPAFPELAFISPTATSPALSNRPDGFFRVVGSNDAHAQSLAMRLARQYALRTVSVILDQRNSAYSIPWADTFAQVFSNEGGQVLEQLAIDGGQVDIATPVMTALQADPEGLLLITSALDVGRASQVARDQLGSRLLLASAEWGCTDALLSLGGQSSDGLIGQRFHDAEDPSERFQAFVQQHLALYQSKPEFAAVMAYDALQVVRAALEHEARMGRSRHARQTLIALEEVQGLQRTIRFNATGDVDPIVFPVRVHRGRFMLDVPKL